MIQSRGNLETGERVASAVLGVALSMLATRAGGPLVKVAAGTAALGLFSRALAGHCGMKAALRRESSLREGMSDQLHHMRESVGGMRESLGGMRDRLGSVRERFSRADRRASPADAGYGTEDASWMSHQQGRVTGAGVSPGAGDSEAGMSGVNS